jgi:hypothetical protein
VLSDLAEHLGLRSRDELLAAFDRAGAEGGRPSGREAPAFRVPRTLPIPCMPPVRGNDLALASGTALTGLYCQPDSPASHQYVKFSRTAPKTLNFVQCSNIMWHLVDTSLEAP